MEAKSASEADCFYAQFWEQVTWAQDQVQPFERDERLTNEEETICVRHTYLYIMSHYCSTN